MTRVRTKHGAVTEPVMAAVRARYPFDRRLRMTASIARSYAALVLLIALFVLLASASPAFLTARNLLNIVEQQSPVAIVAVAATMVIIAGNFDLSTGAIVAVTNVVAALITVGLPEAKKA